jgi:hypothetical protein
VLFVLLPLGVRFAPWPVPPLPLLWLATLYGWLVLRRDPRFVPERLWNLRAGLLELPSILLVFAVLGSLIVLAVRWRAPELFFLFVRQRPALWALVMVSYPILSVYPQGIVYRAFLMHRYRPLLSGLSTDAQSWGLILLSAAAFGFMHLIFRNPIAPAMTLAGGILFAWRYQHGGSLAISSVEHALYGCLLFTVGLGQYFYHGRVRLQ